MGKELYETMFSMPFPQRAIAFILGVILLILPDSLSFIDISLRNWVENIIIFMGTITALVGFLALTDSLSAYLVNGIIAAWKKANHLAEQWKNKQYKGTPDQPNMQSNDRSK
jgi:hypothetical protein